MHPMNGLSARHLARLERQLKAAEECIRQLLAEESAPGSGVASSSAYRERIDEEALAGALNDRRAVLIAGCAATTVAIARSRAAIRLGTYGICGNCGKQIGFERLRTYPTATRCARCAEQRPDRKRQRR